MCFFASNFLLASSVITFDMGFVVRSVFCVVDEERGFLKCKSTSRNVII